MLSRLTSPMAAGIMLFAFLFVAPLLGANEYYRYVFNIMMIYVILTMGLNLVMGFAGQLVFSQAAIFGIGAYGTGLLEKHFGLPFWLTLPAGTIVAIAIGLILVLPALRLSGIYLALATLAFAQCALWVMSHWTSVTFGAGGFTLKQLSFSPIPVSPESGIYYLTWILCVGLVIGARNIVRSRVGRAFVALRDHEVSAQSLGIDIVRYKAAAFALSSLYAGVAGGLFAGMLRFVGPESFDLHQMILQLVAVVLGGIASLSGSVIGGVLIVVVLEVAKGLKLSIEIVFGGLLLFFVLFAKGGVVRLIAHLSPSQWRERLVAYNERPSSKETAL